MSAYYNEFDPFAAQWLRNLIAADLISPGEVDERSITEVSPEDLRGFRQCHFFAGIGGWSLAFRLAGVPDDEPWWTGSCPCQPFSSAGAGGGFDDERHLWPAFASLIRQLAPPVVLGEQVASQDALRWLDLVSGDLEDAGYAFGAADLCSAGIGAPNIRQRLYWVADAHDSERRSFDVAGQNGRHGKDGGWQETHGHLGTRREIRGLADTGSIGRPCDERGQGTREEPLAARCRRMEHADSAGPLPRHEAAQADGHGRTVEPAGGSCRVANPDGRGHDGRWPSEAGDGRDAARIESERLLDAGGRFYGEFEWIPCRDGKLRPTKPGLFPLAQRISGRVGKLRAAGNAINPQLAAEFIRAVREVIP